MQKWRVGLYSIHFIEQEDYARTRESYCMADLCLFVLFSFWRPLHEIATAIPELLAQSETVSIGTVSISLGKKGFIERTSQEVREVLKSLSPSDFRVIMRTDEHIFSVSFPESPDQEIQAMIGQWSRFTKLGLANTKKSGANYVVELTPLFQGTREFFVDLLVQFLAEAHSLQEHQHITR